MMPEFTYPWAFLLLLPLPALAWYFLRSSRGAWRYSDHRLLPAIRSYRAGAARWGGLALRMLGLVLLIIALAGPRWIDEKDRIPTEGISIAMVVDVSVSMAEEDYALDGKIVSRLAGVQERFRLFVNGGKSADGVALSGRRNDLIGLVVFGTHPETACPLTLEHRTLLQIMNEQRPRSAAGEGTTNPGDAIAWALHLLKDAPTRRKVIVFLTDGEINVPRKLMPRQAAQLAANLSIPIYAIDASPEAKNDMEAKELEVTRATMRAIAAMTDGQAFRGQDDRGLVQAYESIDRLERDRILSFQYRQFYEGFAWFALAALFSFVVLMFLEATVWRTTP